MSILFFSSEPECNFKFSQELKKQLIIKEEIESLKTIESLDRRLRRPYGKLKLAVLSAANKEELLSLFLMRNLFGHLPIILLTPDTNKETIALGHKLYPRFITSSNSEFNIITDVINKILENIYTYEIALYVQMLNEMQRCREKQDENI